MGEGVTYLLLITATGVESSVDTEGPFSVQVDSVDGRTVEGFFAGDGHGAGAGRAWQVRAAFLKRVFGTTASTSVKDQGLQQHWKQPQVRRACLRGSRESCPLDPAIQKRRASFGLAR